MRICDGSSDVCSSDLGEPLPSEISEPVAGAKSRDRGDRTSQVQTDRERRLNLTKLSLIALGVGVITGIGAILFKDLIGLVHNLAFAGQADTTYRSEERRVGKACVSPCRSRWSP